MRIALISDIHGNLATLDAVLDDIRREQADQIVCLGDVGANGPQPHEVIQRVRDLGGPVVLGNTDEWFLVPQTYDPNSEQDRRLMDMVHWGMERVTPADIDYMRTFQPRVELSLGSRGTLLCYHGSPRSNRETLFSGTPDDALAQAFEGCQATIMAGGHTHVQMLRRYKEMLILNPGSVGMPPDRKDWVEYAMIHAEERALDVTLKRVPIDVDAVLRAARSSNMPHFEGWAKEWLTLQSSG